jgi:DNA helicase-2/ATP-dependent DNA helicase PcrA
LRESPEVRSALDARYRYLLVDEYQDTNFAQYAIVRALSIDHPNLAVTGDPDQSIYGWRGANLSNILDFEHDFPQVKLVKLEQNYRSTKSILHVADTLIAHNTRRKQKRLFTENSDGDLVSLVHYPTQQDEAESIAIRIAADLHTGKRRARDFAVFYRVNALSRALEFALREQGIPYQMVNGLEFYQRKEIKDVIGYLRLINNPRDDAAFERIINNPPRKIGKATVDRLRAHAKARRKTMLEAAHESGLVEGLTKRAAVQVAKFVHLYEKLALLSAAPVEEIIGHVLIDSGYREHLQTSADEFDEDRLANIEELLTAARQFDELHPIASAGRTGPSPLEEFLEQASLVADTDAWDSDSDRVTLMTMHAAKGLEFPVVFIVALEEGLLPHERSRGELKELEEERRLLFVGITRAQEELQLSLARNRDYRGTRRLTVPSQFLMELPRDAMRVVEPRWISSLESQVDEGIDAAVDDAFDELADFFSAPEDAVEPAHRDEQAPAATAQFATVRELPGLQTAAELHSETKKNAAPRIPVEAFELGMIVKHGTHGLGRIVSLAGSGSRRQATVNFVTAGEHKFMLAHSDLRPAVG